MEDAEAGVSEREEEEERVLLSLRNFVSGCSSLCLGEGRKKNSLSLSFSCISKVKFWWMVHLGQKLAFRYIQ